MQTDQVSYAQLLRQGSDRHCVRSQGNAYGTFADTLANPAIRSKLICNAETAVAPRTASYVVNEYDVRDSRAFLITMRDDPIMGRRCYGIDLD